MNISAFPENFEKYSLHQIEISHDLFRSISTNFHTISHLNDEIRFLRGIALVVKYLAVDCYPQHLQPY